jgi:AcrR family transcriptional regulator
LTSKLLRSQPTRDRILEAARAAFAAEGYDRTSLRTIAASANANVSLIIRYYGSKEELFACAADFDLHLPTASALDPQKVGAALAAHFFNRWEDQESGQQLVALLRASVTYPAAKQKMLEIFSTQLIELVRQISGTDASTEARASLIAAQMLGVGLVKYVLEFPMGGLPREHFIDALGKTLQRYLIEPCER